MCVPPTDTRSDIVRHMGFPVLKTGGPHLPTPRTCLKLKTIPLIPRKCRFTNKPAPILLVPALIIGLYVLFFFVKNNTYEEPSRAIEGAFGSKARSSLA
jgi:hypothetical protein